MPDSDKDDVLPTGIPEFDDALKGGFKVGDLAVIAAVTPRIRFIEPVFNRPFYESSTRALDVTCAAPCPLCEDTEPKSRVLVSVLKRRGKTHKFRNWMKRGCYHARIQKKWDKSSRFKLGTFKPSILSVSQGLYDKINDAVSKKKGSNGKRQTR